MGKIIERRNLPRFGSLIADLLEERGMQLNELASAIGSDPASMSRFLRLVRVPPKDLIDRIIDTLGLDESEGRRLHRFARSAGSGGLHAPREGLQVRLGFRTARRFADYDFNGLFGLIASLGWFCELGDEEDPYDCDVHVMAESSAAKFVGIQFPDPRQAQSQKLLRAARAMAGAHEGSIEVTLFYEGVAGALLAFQRSEENVQQLLLGDAAPELTDAWLRKETKDKGRIVHGGNLIAVLAEYIEPTQAVRNYLKTMFF